VGNGKLTILIGLHFLNDGLLIGHKFYVGPGNTVARLIDNPTADGAVRWLFGLCGGLL
jgi:hypothetical protein